jgi:hypothetical protein
MILIFIALYFVFNYIANGLTITDEPWKIYPSECSYDHCVEIDFQRVPSKMEGSGADSDFSSKFFLEAQERPEEGSDSCTKFDPAATKCLFAKTNVCVKNGTLRLLVPGHFKPNETITVAQVRDFILKTYLECRGYS